MTDEHEPRWDAALLEAGFAVDPDDQLRGRAAAELDEAVDDPDALDDPWRTAFDEVRALSPDQRSYLETSSPALGAALPPQSLVGDQPLDGLADAELRDADDEVIDFD